MFVADIQTPALILDLDAMERNQARMTDFFKTTAAKLRPHTKTHRTPALAKIQIATGAQGICCGNLGEAEVMVRAGIRDVLVTKEIVQLQELALAAELARDSELMVVVDNAEIASKLSQAAVKSGARVRVLMEVDVRLNRAGVAVGEPAAQLARQLNVMPGLRLEGVMGYEGSMHNLDAAQRERACRESVAKLLDTVARIERAGIPVKIVSVGASSTYRTAATIPGVTEIQPGSYLTGDARYAAEWSDFECAISVLTTIVSRPLPNVITTDAGLKKITSDAGLPLVKHEPGLTCAALNEEHCILKRGASARDIQVGEKLELIPFHGGTTINLYERMYGIRSGQVQAVFEISARGK